MRTGWRESASQWGATPLEVPLERVLAIPDGLIREEESMLDFVNAFDEQVRALRHCDKLRSAKG
jgi:hypothetical protein